VSTSKSSAMGVCALLGVPFLCVCVSVRDPTGETKFHGKMLGRLCLSPAVREIHVVDMYLYFLLRDLHPH